MAFCGKCGSPVSDGARFCAQCGNSIERAPYEQQSQYGQQNQYGQPQGQQFRPQNQYGQPQGQPPHLQNQYGQPQYQAPNPQPPQGGKSNTGLIIGIVAAVVVVVVLIVVFVVVKPFDKTSSSESSSSASVSASSSVSSESASSESASSDSSKASSKASSSSASASSASSSKSSSSKSSGSSASTDGADFSTTKKPSLSDFSWATSGAGVMPSDAVKLTSIYDVVGGWKGYLAGGGSPELLFNADIEYKDDGVFVTIKWAKDSDGNKREDSTFNGEWMGGTLDVVGSGRITIDSWWQKDGRQYAVGDFIWPSGEKPTIYLVRP